MATVLDKVKDPRAEGHSIAPITLIRTWTEWKTIIDSLNKKSQHYEALTKACSERVKALEQTANDLSAQADQSTTLAEYLSLKKQVDTVIRSGVEARAVHTDVCRITDKLLRKTRSAEEYAYVQVLAARLPVVELMNRELLKLRAGSRILNVMSYGDFKIQFQEHVVTKGTFTFDKGQCFGVTILPKGDTHGILGVNLYWSSNYSSHDGWQSDGRYLQRSISCLSFLPRLPDLTDDETKLWVTAMFRNMDVSIV